MAGVITASQPSWITPFTGLSPHAFRKLVTQLRRNGADVARAGRPWSLPLEDRVLLVTVYWRTNLTLRQLASLFGVSRSAAGRIVDHTGPLLTAGRGLLHLRGQEVHAGQHGTCVGWCVAPAGGVPVEEVDVLIHEHG